MNLVLFFLATPFAADAALGSFLDSAAYSSYPRDLKPFAAMNIAYGAVAVLGYFAMLGWLIAGGAR